jgi:hypothetical protein
MAGTDWKLAFVVGCFVGCAAALWGALALGAFDCPEPGPVIEWVVLS